MTTQAGLRRIDLRAVVGSDRVGIDINQITFNTDYKVGAAFVCTGGREALVTYSGDDPVSSLDDRSLNCGFGRRGRASWERWHLRTLIDHARGQAACSCAVCPLAPA